MNPADKGPGRYSEGGFLLILILVTIGFAVVVAPLFSAILWALVLAIVFAPINRELNRRIPGRPNAVALLTLLLITLIAVLPTLLLGSMLIQEVLTVYGRIQSGQLDVAALFDRVIGVLPDWGLQALRNSGWADFDSVRDQISRALSGSVGLMAGRALTIGQQALHVFLIISVMLYLAYFLLRDGEWLSKRVMKAVPLEPHQRDALVANFIVVTRATIKGTLVVAIVQGAIGGIVFWALGIEGALLWGTLMGVCSLVPAVGSAIIWVPVALYLVAVDEVTKALILVGCAVFIIGVIDNVLRPILVGRDTRLPDYLVLITTLGGLEVFGIQGLIIGPVFAAMFISAWTIFSEGRDDRVSGAD